MPMLRFAGCGLQVSLQPGGSRQGISVAGRFSGVPGGTGRSDSNLQLRRLAVR